ncbi:MAG: hypothetical protein KQI35_09395 [Bacteroidetes bacterium]|nr:hypothetical protein [Bacteroidota bacterium]
MESEKSLIDLTFLRSFTHQNEEKVKYYIDVYLKTATQLFGDLERTIDTISKQDLYTRVHTLKPQTKYVGIVGLYDLLDEIEIAIKKNEDESLLRKRVMDAIQLNHRGMAELKSLL